MPTLYLYRRLCFLFLLIPMLSHAQIDSRLLTAIRQNNPDEVARALKAGANPNATDSLGATPLMWACFKADTAVVKLLIKSGAKTKSRGIIWFGNDYFANLTGIAVGMNKLPLLRYLIETLKLSANKPEFNPKTGKDDGWTPTEWAAHKGNLAALGYLFECGADLNVAKGNPLVLATWEKNSNILAFLIEQGFSLQREHPEYKDVQEDYYELVTDIAFNFDKQGKYDHAANSFELIQPIYLELGGQLDTNYAYQLKNLGRLYYLSSNYIEALKKTNEALAIYEKETNHPNRSYLSALVLKIEIQIDMGLYDKALSEINDCLLIINKFGGEYNRFYSVVLNSQARIFLITREYEKSLPILESLLKLVKKNPENFSDENKSIIFNNLGISYAATSQNEKSLEAYNQALSFINKRHPFYAQTLNNLSLIYRENGKNDKVIELLQECLKIYETTLGITHISFANTLKNLALTYETLGQIQIATLEFKRAYSIYQHQFINFLSTASEQQQESYLFSKYSEFIEGYSFAHNHYRQQPDLTGWIFDNVLFHKGVLLNVSQNLFRTLEQNPDKTIERLFGQFKNVKASLAFQYSRPINERKGVEDLEKRAEDLQQSLILRSQTFRDIRQNFFIKWHQIQQALKQGEVAIEFISFQYVKNRWTDSTLYAALVIRPEYIQPKFIFLGEQRQIDTLLIAGIVSPEQINGLYRGGDPEGNKGNNRQLACGLALSKFIWQPLDSLLQGVKTVYVSPAGRLHQIALAALPNPVDTNQCMADRFRIRQVGSTRVVALRTAKSEQPLAKNTLTASLYGGIIYEADSLGLVRQRRLKKVQHPFARREATRSGIWDYLKGTQTEVDNLSKILLPTNTTILTGKAATESSVKALSGHSPKILHIATHGFFFPDLLIPKTDRLAFVGDARNSFLASENPLLRSGLVMAGANYVWKGGTPIEGIDDGILTAYELCNLNLSGTELVVLSACETGLGQVKGSEGVYGLQRAVKMAGARYLLMSLWRVSDNETAEYMTLFYSKLLDKGSVLEAYAYAQNQMRTKYPKEPFKWAAFVLVE